MIANEINLIVPQNKTINIQPRFKVFIDDVLLCEKDVTLI